MELLPSAGMAVTASARAVVVHVPITAVLLSGSEFSTPEKLPEHSGGLRHLMRLLGRLAREGKFLQLVAIREQPIGLPPPEVRPVPHKNHVSCRIVTSIIFNSSGERLDWV